MKTLCFAITLLLVVPTVSFAYEKELKELSVTLAENIAGSGKKSVAVVDFANLNGNVTDGGRLFAEEFTVNLAAAGKGLKVIERNRLNTILAEYKLASTGIIDPNTAKKLGQIAGVDAIITGTATPFGDKIRLSVKVLAVDTAQVITAASTTIIKTKENEEIWNLFNATTTTTTAATMGNPQPAGSSVAPPTTYAKVQTRNYLFELRRCQREGSNVVCDIAVTYIGREEEQLSLLCSQGSDQDRSQRGKQREEDAPIILTKAIDDSRQEYPAAVAQLGDQRAKRTTDRFLNTGSIEKSRTVEQSMPSRNPVTASLVFPKVAPDATSLSLLEVGYSAYSAYREPTDTDLQKGHENRDDTLEWIGSIGHYQGTVCRNRADFVIQFRNIPIAKDELKSNASQGAEQKENK